MECNKKFERLDKNVTEEISSFKKIKTKDKINLTIEYIDRCNSDILRHRQADR